MNQKQNIEFDESSFKELLVPYTRRWFWFVVGLIIAMIISFIYLRYSPLKYETKASILIKESSDNGLSSELAPFSSLGLFGKYNKGQLENELVIFRSRRIISKVIKELNLNTKYEIEGRVIASELYPNSKRPFLVSYFNKSELIENSQKIPNFKVTIISETQFELEVEEDESFGNFNFGDKVILPFAEIMLTPNGSLLEGEDSKIGQSFVVSYFKTVNLAINYQEAIEVSNDIQNSNVINIRLQSTNKKKTEDFLDELVRQYNLDSAEDQNLIAKKTAEFIDSRLEIITGDLDSVENNKEVFKTENRLTDINAEAQLVLEGATEFNNKQIDYSTKIEIIESILVYLNQSGTNQLLPASIGLEDGEVSTSIDNYNQLLLERNRLLSNSTKENPVILNIDDQINGLKISIKESLSNQVQGLKVVLREVNRQENKFNSRLSQVPSQEKLFRNIIRQQEIKEQLYIFLLKQREETSIKLASTTSKAKVIDTAFSSKEPIAPKKKIFYLGSGIIGLLIPFLVIYLNNLLNNRVENRKDVESALKGLSLIGEVPKIKGDSDTVIRANDKSVLAESFRILRTNLQYFFINKMDFDKSKTILVTSTIKGEGKTLVAFNLALTLSYSGKKVALVGADIRNPQLQRYLPKNVRKHQGLTEFIMKDDISINEVIVPSEFNNLDIVLSGIIPPNPAELLMQKRTEQFFNDLKDIYDFIIVDTAPSMLVTDTLLINKYGDVTLYVIKANYTDKKLLEFPRDAVRDGRLENVALVLNGVTMNNFGYGNKYGYAYSKEKQSLKERIFG